jgi:hypothetical protein
MAGSRPGDPDRPDGPSDQAPAPTDPAPALPDPARGPRTGTIVFFVAALVAGILAVNVLSALVPGLDGLLAAWPVIVLVLIVGTVGVLVRSLRH